MSEPVEPKPQMTARTPAELIQFHILDARNEAVKAHGMAESERCMGRPDPVLDAIFRGKVIVLYNLVKTVLEDADKEEAEKINIQMYSKDQQYVYTNTKNAYHKIEQLMRQKGITKIDNKKDIDRSRIWKANEADGITPIGHPWWNDKNPYWLQANEKWKKDHGSN